jgi:diacylglycerol O-acyltransferase / wax synthase
MNSFYQVDSEDAAFLFSEKTDNPAHLSLLAWYDPSELGSEVVRFQHLVTLVEKHLPLAPILRRKLKRLPADLDYPYWIDDGDFDIDYHLRHLALPMPGDWRQLCIQVSRLHSRNLDVRRPLWELYVIEGLNHLPDLPAGCFALYLKVHHSAMDEHTAREWLHALHEPQPNPSQHEESVGNLRIVPARDPGPLKLGLKAVTGNGLRMLRLASNPSALYRGFSREMTHWSLRRLRQLANAEKSPVEAQGHFSGLPGPRRVFEGFSIATKAFEDVQQEQPNIRLQHIMVVVCAEAVRRYLGAYDGRAPSGVRVELQADSGNAAAHARTGHQLASFSNDGYIQVADLRERLTAVANTVADIEDHEAELWGSRLRARYENLPAGLCTILSNLPASSRRYDPGTETIGIALSEASSSPIYLQAARCVGLTCLHHLPPGCGLVFSVTRYHGRYLISFTSDHDMLRDPVSLKNHLQDVLTELADLG